MQVIVDGLLTNYLKTGEGETILLLHGWGDNSTTFNPLTRELDEDYQLLAPDLPGFGGTQAPPEAWGIEQYVEFISSWLKKIKAPSLYTVIGHSNGGAIAIKGLAVGALQSDKLILLAASGVRGEYSAKKQLIKLTAKTGKVLSSPLPGRVKQKLKGKLYGLSGSEALLFPQLEDSFRKIVGEDIQPYARKIKQLALLIYGTADHETPPRYGRILNSEIKGSKLELIEGAGHFVHQEQPEQVRQLIEAFLKAK